MVDCSRKSSKVHQKSRVEEISKVYCQVCEGSCLPFVQQGSYSYWKCQNCKTCQLWPQPSKEEIDAFYAKFHKSGEDGGIYEEFESRISLDFPAKVEMVCQELDKVPNNIRLLDVGCGKGFFLREAVKAGFCAKGIDISSAAVEYAKKYLIVDAEIGGIEQIEKSDWHEAFDIITMWATIEHVRNPYLTLKSVFQKLTPNGLFFLDTGLGSAPFEDFLAGHSQWFDAPQHLFVFSQEGLFKLFRKAGFTIISVDTNWERTIIRRLIKVFRHSFLCIFPTLFVRPVLGNRAFKKLQEEAKWPIGRLISIVAKKVIPQ